VSELLFFKKGPAVIPATEKITNFFGFKIKRGESYIIKEPKPYAFIYICLVTGVSRTLRLSKAEMNWRASKHKKESIKQDI